MRGLLLLSLLFVSLATRAGESSKADPNHAYRVDSASENHPQFQLKPGEFPPPGSVHRVEAELVDADFIHRSGQFRTTGTGQLVNFTLSPFGSVVYLNTESDLRDVPLGTRLQFFLYADATGGMTQAAAIHDEFTELARQGVLLHLDEIKHDQGRLGVHRRNVSFWVADTLRSELGVNDRTRVWKADKQVKLADLAVGDEFLVNRTGVTATDPGRCTDIWVGIDAQKRATEQQRGRHVDFIKARGLPAWVDRSEGTTFTVTFFGESADIQTLFRNEGAPASQWATEHRRVGVAVANRELRTYNPPVDQQTSTVLEFQSVPTDRYGCSGIRWTLNPELMLEGFRKGRVVRLFPGWPVNNMPIGEGLYSDMAGFSSDEDRDPQHYPFRTDFANETLPWYQLRPGELPPFESHHLVAGELVKADPGHRSGQFRTDLSGELVNFTMPPFGTVEYLNADGDLSDLPLGVRYFFFLHQDGNGAFTKASRIVDDNTRAATDALTYRLDALKLDEGKLLLARQPAIRKDDKEHLIRPPDVGRCEVAVDAQTRVWKGDKPAKLSDLALGDDLLINFAGSTATSRGRCADIWIGLNTHKVATEQQRARHSALLKKKGLPAWVERVEGNKLSISFFAGNRRDFASLLNGEPPGRVAYIARADNEQHPVGDRLDKFKFNTGLRAESLEGTYCSSGVRWEIEATPLPQGYQAGQIIRVFEEGWPGAHAAP